MNQQADELIEAARAARSQAVAPFSRFAVGAALESRGGEVYTGCNIESATYGLTLCAERVALFKALSEGAREFVRIAIVTAAERPAPPCGACRQLLWEFCGDIEVTLANADSGSESFRLADLYPRPFDASFL